MKVIKLLLKILIPLVIVILIAGFFIIRNISRKSIPDYNQNIHIKELTDSVLVYRDQYAVPHIYAQNEKDLYIATGYLLAQDRLWQMDLLRRVTLGRISEIFGKKFIDADHLLRTLRYSEKSKRILQKADEELIVSLESFALGVNLFIQKHEKKLPPEFTILGYKPEPWEPIHSLNLIGYMAWDLKAGWSELILEKLKNKVDSTRIKELIPNIKRFNSNVFPNYDSLMNVEKMDNDVFAHLQILNSLGTEIFDGSNNWAVSCNKSTTNKPLLANDMHLDLNIPGIWYQIHQNVKGKLNVTGLLLPGQPLVICGHNDSIAWGMTNTYVDNMDFYIEKINPEDSTEYKLNNRWKKLKIVNTSIKTKNGNEVERTIYYTHRGPIISDFKETGNKVVSMQWIGDFPSNEYKSVYLLNRANNWIEFKKGLKTFRSISQNIVYADKKGNIGMFCAAGIPIRDRTLKHTYLPGWTDKYDWKGLVPFEQLPFSYNPSCGYVASANNKTIDESYPYHIGTWYAMPYRYDRIIELLEQKEKLSIDDFKNIQLDQTSKMAEKFVPVILSILKDYENSSEAEKKAIEILKSWNFSMSSSSSAALIFELLYDKMAKNIYYDELDILYYDLVDVRGIIYASMDEIFEANNSVWLDNVNTENNIESFDDIVQKSFSETIEYISEKFGKKIENWEWGKLHKLTLAHPLSKAKILDWIFWLNRGSFSIGGSHHTIAPFTYLFHSPDASFKGASHRHIFDIANWDNSLTVIPTGNSGIPASNHYCDQTEIYVEGYYHKDSFEKDAVIENAEYKMVFVDTID